MKRLSLSLTPVIILAGVALLTNSTEAFANDGYWNGIDTEPFAGGVIRRVHCDLLQFFEGNFGAFFFIVSGLVAFAFAGVTGNTRWSYATIGVGIGMFTLSAFVSLYFGDLCNFEGRSQQSTPLNAVEGMAPVSRSSSVSQSQRSVDAAVGIASGRESSGIQTGQYFEDSEGGNPF